MKSRSSSASDVSATRNCGPSAMGILDRVFQRERHTHAAADAQRGHTLFCVALQHLVQERHRDSSSRATDGMSESDRASVDVEAVSIEVQHAITGEDLGGECFVQFDKSEFVHAEVVLVCELLERRHGTD